MLFKNKSFGVDIATYFSEVLLNSGNEDVTLVGDDEIEIHAHKIILSAASPVLKNILFEEDGHPVLYFTGFNSNTINAFKEMLYHGKTSFFNHEQIKEVGKICDDFQIPGKFAIFPKVPKIIKVENEKPEIKSKNERNQSLIRRDVDGQFVCEYCNKHYISPSGLYAHRRTAHEGLNFVCQFCQQNFRQKAHMLTHVNSKHFGIRYTCQLCDTEFVNQAGLKFHEKNKHDENFKKFECSDCAKTFTQKGALKAHFEGVHLNIHYDCTFCDYKSIDKSNLNKHNKKFHKDKIKSEPATEVKVDTKMEPSFFVKVDNIEQFW